MVCYTIRVWDHIYLQLQHELLRCRGGDDDAPRVLFDEAFVDSQVDEG
jgi:hypothetical protein